MGKILELKNYEFQRICWLADNYIPSTEQAEFHRATEWLRQVVGGVRGGKSYSTARECDKYTATNDGLGWLIGPDFNQPRAEFTYLHTLYDRLGFLDSASTSMPREGSWAMETKWGFRWETKTSTDVTKLASFAPDVLVMCEAAQQTEEAFFKCVERATQKNADLILSGTFETSLGWYADWFYRLSGHNDLGGKAFQMPSWSNRKEFPLGFNDPKIQRARRIMPDDLFWERYGGKPTKPSGIVFKHFDRRLHYSEPMPYDPEFPLEIAVDPGFHAYSILFIQWSGPLVWIVDEIYRRNVIAQEMIPLFLAHPLSKHVTSGVMDIAGKQHQANYSQLEVWRREFEQADRTPIAFRTRKIREEEWRNAIALRLGNDGVHEPMLKLHTGLSEKRTSTSRALGIVAEFELYKWPKRPEEANLPNRPMKLNEDALSALGYWLVDRFGPVIERKPREVEEETFSYFF